MDTESDIYGDLLREQTEELRKSRKQLELLNGRIANLERKNNGGGER